MFGVECSEQESGRMIRVDESRRSGRRRTLLLVLSGALPTIGFASAHIMARTARMRAEPEMFILLIKPFY